MKYALIPDEYIMFNSRKLYRIIALKSTDIVRKGDKGGFVESETNLDQEGNCWVADDAEVSGNAIIRGKCPGMRQCQNWREC